MRLPTLAGGRIATHFRNKVIPKLTRGVVQRQRNNTVDSKEQAVPQAPSDSQMYLPNSLSPPLPLQSTPSSPVSVIMPANQHPNQFGNGIDHDIEATEKRYDAVRDEREDLMGSRFRLQSIRGGLRSLREQTGAQEGLAINRLKQFLLVQGVALPEDIRENFDRIDTLRDKLGLREAEYEDAERAYDMQELAYNSRESELFDSMFSVDRMRPLVLDASLLPMDENVTTDVNPNSTGSWHVIHHSLSGDNMRLLQKTVQPPTDANIHLVIPPYVHYPISYKCDRTD